MAGITYYSQGSGLWSTVANWNTVAGGGGSNPASVAAMEDNLFTIQAGHVIDLDIDTSAWTTGFQTITITGSNTTPGMLRCDSTNLGAGTYQLNMKTGFSVVGSSAAITNHGRILSNSDGVWENSGSLAQDRKFVINTLAGASSTSTISGAHLEIRLYCTQPTNTMIETYGVPFVVTFTNATNIFTIISPTNTPAIPPNGTPITLSGTLPAELSVGVTYWVRDVSGATGKLATTYNGTEINISTDGSGTIYMHYGKWGPVNQTTAVNTTTGEVNWGGDPPIVGTAVKVKSSGTLPTGWSEIDVFYVRSISGTSCKLAILNNDASIIIPSDTGTGNISMYCGSTYTNSAVMNVIQDITADEFWTTTSGHNAVVLFDNSAPEAIDAQKTALSTITSTEITISVNVDSAQFPCALIVLSSRNISLRSASTSTSQTILMTLLNGVLQCEIRNISTGTVYSYGINNADNCYISGVVSGCSIGLLGCDNNTILSIICGCTSGLSTAGGNNTILGSICGCTNALSSDSNNNNVYGPISGCSYCTSGCDNNIFYGPVSGCYYCSASNSNNNSFYGPVSGCGTGFSIGNNNIVYGDIYGCISTQNLTGYNTIRNISVIPVITGRNVMGVRGRLRVENMGRIAGNNKIYDVFGDIIKTACDGTGDAPSVDPNGGNEYCIEVSNVQSNLGKIETGISGSGLYVANYITIIEEQRIWLSAATHTITYKIQTTYTTGISAGNLLLSCYYLGTNGATTLVTHAPAITQRTNNADWTQTLTVSFTSTQEGWASINIKLMEYESICEVYVWPNPLIT